MKAILVNEDRSLRWDEVSNPVLKEDEVLMKVEYAALNRAALSIKRRAKTLLKNTVTKNIRFYCVMMKGDNYYEF